ncbi:MAG: adenosine deaminase family protein [Kiritimatiellae bacterium]|nr:adenosine deaminase family protein [Kiritimatiellia bacterium]
MAQRITEEFVRRIPKTELHVHLDGSLRIPTLIELAKAGKVKLPAYSEEGLRKKVFKDFYKDLPDYLAGFGYTCAVMQNAENVERIAYELAVDHLAEGVRYVEVRFAPQLHAHEDFSMEDVVRATARGFERAQKEHNRSPDVKAGRDIPFHFGIILCALRFFNEYMSPYYAAISRVMPFAQRKQIIAAASQELARAAAVMKHELGLPVVAFDLAGAEAGYPAEDHKAAFQFAHSNFIRKTVHAGEAYGPESIFQAITDCYADRLGHGTWLFADEMVRNPAIEDPKAYVHNLVDYIASQRICIEVCLTSNLQTLPHMKSIAKHPLRKMLDHGLSVSICTDNRLMSNTTVTNEIMLAVKHLNLTQRELRNVIVAGFKGSFFPGDYTEKRAYVRQVIDRYEQLKAEHLK